MRPFHPTGRPRALPAAVLCLLLACLPLAACAVNIRDSGLAERASSRWFYLSKSSPKTLYSVNDEKVTYWAKLEPRIGPPTESFRVEWIDPDGNVFLDKKIRNSWGAEDQIVTSLPIRDNFPSRQPGSWKVRLYKGDELLDQARFNIESADGNKPGGSP